MSEEPAIGIGTAFMMVIVALIIDGIQALLTFILIGFLVNPVISVCAAMVFGIWFSHHGMSMMSPKNIAPFLGTMLGEFTPVINAFPVWTGFVIFKVIRSKAKEIVEPPIRNRGASWRL